MCELIRISRTCPSHANRSEAKMPCPVYREQIYLRRFGLEYVLHTLPHMTCIVLIGFLLLLLSLACVKGVRTSFAHLHPTHNKYSAHRIACTATCCTGILLVDIPYCKITTNPSRVLM